jgi:hypothetical protein
VGVPIAEMPESFHGKEAVYIIYRGRRDENK